MALKYLFYGAVGAAASAVLLGNLSPLFVPAATLASLDYLAKAKLQTIESQPKNFSEAEGLASLLPEMEAHGVRLHAVVHETLGAEEFKPFIKGEVYWDIERTFYGPQERWHGLASLFSYNALKNIACDIWKGSVPGNVKGEGRLMGAVFVIGPGSQGILYQHNEKIYGDYANLEDVRKAIQKIKKLS